MNYIKGFFGFKKKNNSTPKEIIPKVYKFNHNLEEQIKKIISNIKLRENTKMEKNELDNEINNTTISNIKLRENAKMEKNELDNKKIQNEINNAIISHINQKSNVNIVKNESNVRNILYNIIVDGNLTNITKTNDEKFKTDIEKFIKEHKIINNNNNSSKELFIKIVNKLRSEYINILTYFSDPTNAGIVVDIDKVKNDIKKRCYKIIKVVQ